MARIIHSVLLFPCTNLVSPIFNLDFDFASPVFSAPALSGPPHLVPQVEALCFVFTNGALPHQARTPVPKAAMIYKLANSHPAQAVDTSDNSRRVNGDGGGAAGTSLAGKGAVGAISNHPCEIPLQYQSISTVAEPNISRRSWISRTSRSPSFGLSGLRVLRVHWAKSLINPEVWRPGVSLIFSYQLITLTTLITFTLSHQIVLLLCL